MRKIKLLFAAVLSMIAWTGVMAQSGTGAQNDPFVVKTAAELNNLRTLLVSGSMNYVVLENDVDMAAIEDWFPLFNNENPYPQFDFDGKGHVIRNLTSKTDGQYDYCGLFGVLCGNVRNLGVENADVTCTGGTGIIAGYLGHSQYGQTCYVENVWVTGKLSASGYCGGMFGNIANEAHITNCYANVEVNGESDLTGGIIGRVRAAVVMTNVYAAGSINKGGGIIGGGFQDATAAGSYKNVAVWNNTENNFGPARESDTQSGILYYNGTNFAELQEKVVAWDPTVWSCDMAEGSYPVLSFSEESDNTVAQYEAALAAITDGACYRISVTIDGTKYYVTSDGTLSSSLSENGLFILNKITGTSNDGPYVVAEGVNAVGIQMTSTAGKRFTNAPLSNNKAVLDVSNFSTSTSSRPHWESQVLFLKDGKFAIRTCNTIYEESGWKDAGRVFWTYKVAEAAVTPQYTYDPAYVWNIEQDEFATSQYAAKNTVEAWPVYIQSAAGLVKDASKYISNAKSSAEGSYEALLDGDYATYFHSTYSNGPDADHYLQAELSEATQKFEFYYKKRSQNNNNRPTKIVISGGNSADGEFTDVKTIDSGLPTEESTIDYMSSQIDLGAAYKFVRFTIPETNNNAQNNNHVFFTFSEFYMFPGEDAAVAVANKYNEYSAKAWTEFTEADVEQINTIDRNLKSAISTINVTYALYEADGTTLVSKQTVVQKPYSEVNVPSTLVSQPLFYDYNVTGTIGETDCEIKIVRTLKPEIVGDLTELSNNKAYTITCDRGAMLTNGETIASTSNSTYAESAPGQFAIISYEDHYYLYSVADSKFVANNGYLVEKPSNGVLDAIQMTPKTVPYFLYYFVTENGNYGVNTNGTGALGGIVINSWMNADAGNQYYMIEAADFDPTNALKALNDQFHPAYSVIYKVKDASGNIIFTSDPEPVNQGTVVTTLPDKYHRAYYTYDEVNVTIETTGGTDAVFTATWNGPFEISADYNNAHWYNMAVRGSYYVTTDKPKDDGSLAPVLANAVGLVEDSYQWAFTGNGYAGFKLFNKGKGAELVYAWVSNDNASIPTFVNVATANTWFIKASTSSISGAFMLTTDKGYQTNQFGGASGSLKIWQSTGTGDVGSAFTVFDVPTNFAEYVNSEIAPYFEGKYFVFNDAAKAQVGYDPAYKEDCPYESYKNMKEKMTAEFTGNVANYVLPETGVYFLKSKYYPEKGLMGMDPSDANMYGDYAAIKDARNYVTLTKVGDKTYTISLMGKFAPATVAASTPVVASTEAGTYTVVITKPGYAAFQADPEVEYSALHRRQEGDIVGWEPTADASMWAAEDATSINIAVGPAGYATTYMPFPLEIGESLAVPAAKGAWTFDDGTTGTLTATSGVTVANGVATVPAGDNLAMATGAEELGTYTLMMDVKVVNEDNGRYTALYLNNVNNTDDGSLYIYNHKTNGRKVGIALASMGYGGNIELDNWYRIVVSCENSLPTVYVDGVKATAAGSANDRWTLADVIYFFADNLTGNGSGEENLVQADELRFWDVALTADEVSMLGAYGDPEPVASSVAAYAGVINQTWLDLVEIKGTIPAMTGVVLKGDPGVYEFAIAKTEAAPIEENDLKGTLEPIDATGKYVLAQPEGEPIGFYLANGGQIKAGKAYLEYNGAAGIKAFQFAGDATGIANVEKNVENGPIYNIAGQRLNKVQKGINIVNGKKVLY